MATKDINNISGLLRAVDLFLDLRKETPIYLIKAFLLICENEGQPLKFYADRLGTAQSSTSRFMSELGKYGQRDMPGLNLVEHFEDPIERRRKAVRLTDKGRRFRDQLIKALEE